MGNPVVAKWAADCEGCDTKIQEDDLMYFTDEGKICTDCAESEGFVCYCGNFKKLDFDQCYDCANGGQA